MNYTKQVLPVADGHLDTNGRPFFSPDVLDASVGHSGINLDIGSNRAWHRWSLTVAESQKLRSLLEAAERKVAA